MMDLFQKLSGATKSLLAWEKSTKLAAHKQKANLVKKFLISPTRKITSRKEVTNGEQLDLLTIRLGCATPVIGWNRIFVCFFLDVGLLLRFVAN